MGGAASKGHSANNSKRNSTRSLPREGSPEMVGLQLYKNEPFEKTSWYNRVISIIGTESVSIEQLLVLLRDKLSIISTPAMLKGLQENDSTTLIPPSSVLRLYSETVYNPFLGTFLRNAIIEEGPTPALWTEYTKYEQLANTKSQNGRRSSSSSSISMNEISPSRFSDFVLGHHNTAVNPVFSALEAYNLPLTHYFINSGKLIQQKHGTTPESYIKIFCSMITSGVKALEIEISGGADGEPRCFADTYPENQPLDSLPLLKDTLLAFKEAVDSISNHEKPLHCGVSGTELDFAPVILVVSITQSCSQVHQEKAAEHISEILGTRIELPVLNDDASIWTVTQLAGKVVLCGLGVPIDDASIPSKNNPTVSPALEALMKIHTIRIPQLRPLLEKATSRAQLKTLFQDKLLVVNAAEAGTHLIELAPITEMLLVFVQTSKRIRLKTRRSSLSSRVKGSYETKNIDSDTRFKVDFYELGETGSITIRESNVNEDLGSEHEELEPLRGWKYGAHMLPVWNSDATDAKLMNWSLFTSQQIVSGYIPKQPRKCLSFSPDFFDLYNDWNKDYQHSLFITVMSASGIHRSQDILQPFMKIFCNNGSGLKQTAITTVCEDNGYMCLWDEVFEFKLDLTDTSSASIVMFAIMQRDGCTEKIIAWSSVPLWALRTGTRSLQLRNPTGQLMDQGVILANFIWEEDMY